MRRALGRGLVVAGAALAAAPGAAWSQGGATVRGRVRSSLGEPIPYAVVALAPSIGQRFTDDSGRFVIAAVATGRYRLLVRQVGFRPFDTTVVKAARVPLDLTITLERITVRLAEISVVAAGRCTTPGVIDSAAPDLAAVFDQLRQNAERYALLADSYPFRYRLSRTFTDYDETAKVLRQVTDTVSYQSNARLPYRPGNVVALGPGRGGETQRVLRLPTLSDLVDSTFRAHHCFSYDGVVDGDSGRVVRFAFRPAESLRMPDIEGQVDLDSATYQIRSAVIRLTRPGRALEGLQAAHSTMTFTALVPNIVLPSRVFGVLEAAPMPGAQRNAARSTEDQRLIDVHFLRALPGGLRDRRP
jgi:hypothetical protein